MEKIRVYMDDPETGERKYGSVTVDKLSVALAKGFKVAEQQVAAPSPTAAPVAAPAAPAAAAAPEAPAAPAEEGGGFMGGLNALLTGAGRGATFDFLDELRGAAAAAGGQIGGRLAGVPSEFLAQEDFYTQGREEEQARQRQLEQESPLLTMAGQVAGTLPYAAAFPGAGAPTLAMAPGRLAPAAARLAQAAPTLATMGALTGLGRTEAPSAGGMAADVVQGAGESLLLGAGFEGLRAGVGGARNVAGKVFERLGKDADRARVLTAGQEALKRVKKDQGGVDIPEAARVMRQVGIKGVMSPEAIAQKSEAVSDEAGTTIRRIVRDVDIKAAQALERAEKAKETAQARRAELQAMYADKVKAAEEAARNADEIEASVAAAEKRLLDEKREVFSASTTSGVRPPAKGIREPGVTRVNDADLQRRAKEAADDAAAKVAAAKDALKAAQKQEKLTTKGSFAPDPLTGETALAPSGRDPLMFKAALLQNDADMAVARANQIAEEARLGAASAEEPMGMREVVSANKTLQGRQRELDMMRAAAKKAREDANRLTAESKPNSVQQGGVDAAEKEAERLMQEAVKRRVSGDDVARALRDEANSMLVNSGRSPENLSTVSKATYDALMAAAERNRGLTLSLEQMQAELKPLARAAKFEQGAVDEAIQGRALAAREESRAARRLMDTAVEEALPTTASSSAFESMMTAVGKGKPVVGPPAGKEGYQSARRVFDVMEDITAGAEKEVEKLRDLGLSEKLYRSYAPSLKATALEKSREIGRSMQADSTMTPFRQAALRSLPYGSESFAEMLRQIDEEAAQ